MGIFLHANSEERIVTDSNFDQGGLPTHAHPDPEPEDAFIERDSDPDDFTDPVEGDEDDEEDE